MDETEIELFEKWYVDFDGLVDCQGDPAKDDSDHYLLTEASLFYTGWTVSHKCNRWSSIDRNIPNIGETIIVHTENGNTFPDIYVEGHDGDYFETTEGFNEQVTHWQSLPIPP